ncbi:olfactory receptor 52L1-like [Pelodiscus sinensis]|uniref:olfactory receptor 52L1-like n=1 Tax=Pelodiscus sinensis TaxID=13735 RepID=UPI003F6AD673
MAHSNTTDFTNPSTFILLGIPGMEAAYVWLSIPFSAIYAIAVLGNLTILFIMFFIHCFTAIESGILAAMALDRYVAICHPLRYSAILTNPLVAKVILAVVLRSSMETLPYPFLARRWPYCRTVSINAPYCVHIAVVQLACGNTYASSYYGLFVLFCVLGLDVVFIAISYMQILRAIFRLPTKEARLKTFWTCGSHLCAIIIFYIPSAISSLMSRFGQNFPLHVNVLFGNTYLLLPPMLNPIIYGVKTKQIRGRLLRLIAHN